MSRTSKGGGSCGLSLASYAVNNSGVGNVKVMALVGAREEAVAAPYAVSREPHSASTTGDPWEREEACVAQGGMGNSLSSEASSLVLQVCPRAAAASKGPGR